MHCFHSNCIDTQSACHITLISDEAPRFIISHGQCSYFSIWWPSTTAGRVRWLTHSHQVI